MPVIVVIVDPFGVDAAVGKTPTGSFTNPVELVR
jgi:hypothetical protein